ncbi:MAG: DUF4147 domain-containing protein [Anaerolineae bacterium]|jgi:hypothetical protein|nr:DUF4147 domain-containing protein [Anaerolineae bacterium]MBT7073248.1 DUF4147 domain-containing protein [Anaerolineae bacterium]MBT7325336.1 DUF4147 domain-containing protein [Anaerolineae bacterium]
MISLLISDVVNSPLEAIASGPTVRNPTNNVDALTVLQKYSLLKDAPAAVLDALKKEILLNPKIRKEILSSSVVMPPLLKPPRLKLKEKVFSPKFSQLLSRGSGTSWARNGKNASRARFYAI